MNKRQEIGKYISILQRLGSIYYTNELASYQIGCGQQFFLLQIFMHPGISLQELAAYGFYDKATATRAVQKLEEEEYVTTHMDETDKRIRRIFPTPRAEKVVDRTLECIDQWEDIVLKSFTEEERKSAGEYLIRMTRNAAGYIGPAKQAGRTPEHRRKE